MKPFLVLPVLLISLQVLAADEPATPSLGEAAVAGERDAPVFLNLRRAIQRLPAEALRSREAAGTGGASEATTAARTAPVDLSGNWLLTLPAGYQYRVTFDAQGADRYRLRNAACFSGVYQLNGEVLQIVEPSDERLDVFDWQLHNINSMTLVDETGASGAHYAGATMGRQVAWGDEELPKKITAIGRPAVPRPRRTTPPSAAARQVTLTGTAFDDKSYGPYLETDETIVFISGLEAWPEEVLGQTVRVTGKISRFLIQDQGESLTAQRLEVESWSRADPEE